MSDASTEVIEKLDALAEQRFLAQVKLDKATEEYKTAIAVLTADHEKVQTSLQSEINALDSQIYDTIQANRNELIRRGKKSFAIMKAVFQFRSSDPKTKIADSAGIMSVARKLGVVRQIAKVSISWKLNQSKFFQWLDKHGELRPHFEDYLEEVEAGESLTMKPNTNYTVFHDSKRISPPSISIKTS